MADVNEIVSKEAIKGIQRLETATKKTAKEVKSLYDVSKKLDSELKMLGLSTKKTQDNQKKLNDAQKQALQVNKQTIQVRSKLSQIHTKEAESLNKVKSILAQETTASKKASEVKRSQTTAWKKSQKAIEESTVALGKSKRAVKLQATANVEAKGSYNQLAAQLSININKYKGLTVAQQKAGKGQEILKNIQKQDKALKKLDATMGRSQRNVGNYGEAFTKSFAKIGLAVAGVMAAWKAVTGLIGGSIEKLKKQERAEFSLAAAIKNRGDTTKLTYDELKKEAARLQTVSVIGDEDILKGITAQLLTFTNVTDEAFFNAQKAVMNIATTLSQTGEPAFTELKSVALQLGKALNDPIGQMGALSRSGIMFSAENKKVIKSLASSGRMAEAQALMLKEVNAQYGGQFKAMAKSTGIITQTKNMIGDLAEKFGGLLMIGIYPLIKGLKSMVGWLGKVTSASPVEAIQKEKSEVNILISSITSLNKGNEQRRVLLQKLNDKYPDLLKSLNIETVTNDELLQKLLDVNMQYEKKIRLAINAAKMAGIEEDTTKQMEIQQANLLKVTEYYAKYYNQLDQNVPLEEKLIMMRKAMNSTNDFTLNQRSKMFESAKKYGLATANLAGLSNDYNEVATKRGEIESEAVSANEKLTAMTTEQLTALSTLSDEELRRSDIVYSTVKALGVMTESDAKNTRQLYTSAQEINNVIDARRLQIDSYNEVTGKSREYTTVLSNEEKAEMAKVKSTQDIMAGMGDFQDAIAFGIIDVSTQARVLTETELNKVQTAREKAQKDYEDGIKKAKEAAKRLADATQTLAIGSIKRTGEARNNELQNQLANEQITESVFNDLKAQNSYDTNAAIIENEAAFIVKALENKKLEADERVNLQNELANKLQEAENLLSGELLRQAKEDKDELVQATIQANEAELSAARQKVVTINATANAALLFQKQRYAEGIISAEEYKEAVIKIELEKNLDIIAGEMNVLQVQRDQLQERLDTEKLLPEVKQGINDQLTEIDKNLTDMTTEMSDIRTDHQLANYDKEAEALEQLKAKKIETMVMLGNAAFEFASYDTENKLNKLNIDKENELKAAGDNADQKALIEEKYNEKIIKIKRKQAIRDKAQAIFSIFIDTWVGVAASLKTPALIPWIIAQGAIAAALVAAKPIPKFAKGIKSSPEGLAEIGEAGRELGVTPTGKAFMAEKGQIVDLEKGTRIFNKKETEEIVNNMSADKIGFDMTELMDAPTGYNTLTTFNEMYASLDTDGIIAAIGEGNDKVVDTIKRKRELHIYPSKQKIVEREGRYFKEYLNTKIRM